MPEQPVDLVVLGEITVGVVADRDPGVVPEAAGEVLGAGRAHLGDDDVGARGQEGLGEGPVPRADLEDAGSGRSCVGQVGDDAVQDVTHPAVEVCVLQVGRAGDVVVAVAVRGLLQSAHVLRCLGAHEGNLAPAIS